MELFNEIRDMVFASDSRPKKIQVIVSEHHSGESVSCFRVFGSSSGIHGPQIPTPFTMDLKPHESAVLIFCSPGHKELMDAVVELIGLEENIMVEDAP